MSSKFAACDESFFGINCIQKCDENCHNRACHHETGECLRFHMVLFLYFNIVHINIKFTALRQSDNLKICCIFLSFFLTDDALDQLFGRCIYVLNLVFFSIKITHEYTLCQCRILLQNFSFVGGSIAVIVMSFLVGIVIYR